MSRPRKMYRKTDEGESLVRTSIFITKEDMAFCQKRGGLTAVVRRMIQIARLTESVTSGQEKPPVVDRIEADEDEVVV
jgi:hypothetical protein